jgi:small subunit ribosomal protein S15
MDRRRQVTGEAKKSLVQQFAHHSGDTGSADVQVALLTQRIEGLTDHLKDHRKDFNCRRSLLKMVGQRRRMLKYLRNHHEDRYVKLIQALNLRHI